MKFINTNIKKAHRQQCTSLLNNSLVKQLGRRLSSVVTPEGRSWKITWETVWPQIDFVKHIIPPQSNNKDISLCVSFKNSTVWYLHIYNLQSTLELFKPHGFLMQISSLCGVFLSCWGVSQIYFEWSITGHIIKMRRFTLLLLSVTLQCIFSYTLQVFLINIPLFEYF